ncbi:hypothetical protein HDU79_004548 [Rhizoclosmatium sp. JEL0117]|nr:hypothetical protein HDU79_004548 [Rhizoclosmatium sp. JEL0117]
MPTNSPSEQVALVETYLNSLPACDVACLQTLPEWTQPLTADSFAAVCKNLQADLNHFGTCLTSRCTATDIANVKLLLPIVKEGCNYLGINVANVIIPDIAAPVVTGGVPANAATEVSGNNPVSTASAIPIAGTTSSVATVRAEAAGFAGAASKSGAAEMLSLGLSPFIIALFV